MATSETLVAVFPNHDAAETGLKTLAQAGFDLKTISIVGKGYHSEEKIVGFYSTGDRVKFWGGRGAFWGGLWGLFFGGLFVSTSAVGPVVVLGYLSAAAIAAVEGALIVGGLSALGAALYSIGIPRDSVIEYETALKSDEFLLMTHGRADDIARARAILGAASAARLDCFKEAPQASKGSIGALSAIY